MKSKVDKSDIYKSVTITVDLSKLSYVAKNNVFKKGIYIYIYIYIYNAIIKDIKIKYLALLT